jgi:23S rRNA (adenine2503-C2)-methyltransferase
MDDILGMHRSEDDSAKYLWRLGDGHTVESVYLPLMNRGAEGPSMCISSQVGCAVCCTFCATGKDGLPRNLTVDEITGQVHRILASLGTLPSAFDASFMGMGEPPHNLPTIKSAIKELHAVYSPQCVIVGAENPVRPAQATIRYSWMRPPK